MEQAVARMARLIALGSMGMVMVTGPAVGAPNCDKFSLDPTASTAELKVTLPPSAPCSTRLSHDMPIPDPECTPGAYNPGLTIDVLRDPEFGTPCIRDQASSAAQKAKTYAWYGIRRPRDNEGQTQTCELDHLISLELGGADTLDNLWPQCGPSDVALAERFFKQKDMVENYLAAQVRAGTMELTDVQKGISSDWTQYLDAAKAACQAGHCR